MNIYRMHKYNPKCRNSQGHYEKNEWISINEIGNEFNGEPFTWAMYEDMEQRYLQCIHQILKAIDIEKLSVFPPTRFPQILLHKKCTSRGIDINDIPFFHPNEVLTKERIAIFSQLCLRNLMSTFSLTNGHSFFMAFMDDYYVYIGCSFNASEFKKQVREKGLFFEKLGKLGDKGIDTNYFDAVRQADLEMFMDAC